MLKEMQDDTRDANAERKKQGYDEVELVGWATKPHYDHADNKLYWAKELAFGDRADHTLNYDIRALGRKGYLSLNAIADMSQLPRVEEGMQRVLGMTEFDPGSRYADFHQSTAQIAPYGIAALVSGATAAKARLFTHHLPRFLAARAGIPVIEESGGSSSDDRQHEALRTLLKLHAAATEWFQNNLLKSEIGQASRDYLKNRGITSALAK